MVFLWDIDKQYILKSDATEHVIELVSILFTYRMLYYDFNKNGTISPTNPGPIDQNGKFHFA